MIKKFITTVILGIVAYTGVFGLPMMVAAQTETNVALSNDPAATVLDAPGIQCGFISEESSVMGCVAQFMYYIVYVPSNWIAGLTGILLDFGLGFTLDSDSYQNTEGSFVTQGWQIVRDLANIAFIFVLLVVAISQILGIAGWGAKQMLAKIIIAALLINFSLFFSKVIVDTGNLLGLAFYNSISVENNQQLSGYKDISVGIADKFQPQKLFGIGLFDSLNSAGLSNPIGTSGSDAVGSESTLKDNELASFFTLITLLAAGVNIVMIGVFFTVGILMIARVIGIWIAMILSPLAFVSYAIPGGTKWGKIGFDNWIKELVKLAIMAPMFLFFLYLIISFVNADPVKAAFQANPQADNLLLKIMVIAVPFILIMVLLRYAKKLTKDFSGEIGEATLKFVKTVGAVTAGVVGGAALGGAAVAGRAVIGKAASNLGSGSFKNMANSDSKLTRALGRRLQGVADKTSKASFDARQTGLGKKISGNLEKTGFGAGVGFNNQAVNMMSLQTREGGYDGVQERRQKLRETQAERMMMTGDEAVLHDKNIQNRRNQYDDDEKVFKEELESAFANNPFLQNISKAEKETKIEESVQKFREEYIETGNILTFSEAANDGTISLAQKPQVDNQGNTRRDANGNPIIENRGSGEVRMSGEINNDRKKKFAQELRQGAGASFAGINNAVRGVFGADYEGKPGDTNPMASLGSIQAAQSIEKTVSATEKTMKSYDKTLQSIKESIKENNTKLENTNLGLNPRSPDVKAQIDAAVPGLETSIDNLSARIQTLNAAAAYRPLTAVEQTELANNLNDKRNAERKLNILNSFMTNKIKLERDERETEMKKKQSQSSDKK